MKSIFGFLAISICLLLASCTGCSRSGRLGPKKILSGTVLTTNTESRSFLLDTNYDKKPDAEVFTYNRTSLPPKDSTVYCVFNGGKLVRWYK